MTKVPSGSSASRRTRPWTSSRRTVSRGDQHRELVTAREHGYAHRAERGTSVERGASVTIWVSNGKVAVPNVVGRTLGEAKAALTDSALNLKWKVAANSKDNDDAVVTASNPSAGSQVNPGTEVTLTTEPKESPSPSPSPSNSNGSSGSNGNSGNGDSNSAPSPRRTSRTATTNTSAESSICINGDRNHPRYCPQLRITTA